MTVYVENPMESKNKTKQNLEPISQLSKVAIYKTDTQKSIAFQKRGN